jgi:predicted transcriptional regulator YheO
MLINNTKDAIMGLLDFVILDLNFVPLKELAVLSLHLQSKNTSYHIFSTFTSTQVTHSSSIVGTNSNGKLVGLICKCLTGQLQRSPKLVVVARESGLINMMSLMLSNVNEYLNEEASANSGSTNDGSSFIQNILADFDTVVKCVVEMIKDQTNMAIFRKL